MGSGAQDLMAASTLKNNEVGLWINLLFFFFGGGGVDERDESEGASPCPTLAPPPDGPH